MNSRRLSGRKKQGLALDSSRPFPTRHLRVDVRRPQREDLPAVVGSCVAMAVLLLRHGWVVSLPKVYSRWGSDCEQDRHDASRRRKHPLTALPSATPSQDAVLLQAKGDVETCHSIAPALAQVLGCSCSCLIHPAFQQRPLFYRVFTLDDHFLSVVKTKLDHAFYGGSQGSVACIMQVSTYITTFS